MPHHKIKFYKLIVVLFFSTNAIAQIPGDTPVQLRGAIQLAEQNYHLLKSKKLEANAAGKNVDVTKYSRLPTIEASYQANISTANNLTGQFYPYGILPMTGPPSFNNNYSPATGSAASILLNWQAITFGQRNAQIDLSVAEAKTKTSDWQQELFNHKINVISTYLDLLLTYDIVNIQHRNIERVQESLRQSLELTKSGIKPGVDTALFQSELSKAKIDWLNAQNQLQTEQLLLEELIIIDPLPVPTDTAFLNRLPIMAINKDTSFAAHPSIQSAQSQFDFNKLKEQFLRKSYLPKLSLWGTGFARGSGFHADGTMKTWDGLGLSRYNYGAGVQLSFPIMKYGEVKQQLREQNLLSEAAYERLLDVKNTLTTQQRLANTTFNSSIAVAAESQQQLKSGQYAYYAMQIRYNTGLVNFSDLIQAQYNLLKAELDLKKSYWDSWKALLLQAAVKGDENIFLQEIR
jgi:outer membrane protein TolC